MYNEKAHPATGFAILKLNLMVRHIFSKWLLCFAKKADIIIIVILLEGWKPHGYGIFSSPLWGVVPIHDNPNCIFQIGDVFGFFIPIERIL